MSHFLLLIKENSVGHFPGAENTDDLLRTVFQQL